MNNIYYINYKNNIKYINIIETINTILQSNILVKIIKKTSLSSVVYAKTDLFAY